MIVSLLVFIIGAATVAVTLYSAVKTFILPRGIPSVLTRSVFYVVRTLFMVRTRRSTSYRGMDRIMAFYAPVTLMVLLPVWVALVLLGYMGMFWAVNRTWLYQAFRVSGSSLLTLGFESAEGLLNTILSFSEATIGLMLVALLIADLPTMDAAFSRRESAVTLLEVRVSKIPCEAI